MPFAATQGAANTPLTVTQKRSQHATCGRTGRTTPRPVHGPPASAHHRCVHVVLPDRDRDRDRDPDNDHARDHDRPTFITAAFTGATLLGCLRQWVRPRENVADSPAPHEKP